MSLALSAKATRVVVEVHAAGLLAAAAHDLRLVAEGASGESVDEVRLVARFPIAGLKVQASRRHGTRDWHDPSPADAADIERRIRSEVFLGAAQIEVEGTVDKGRAQLTVRAPAGSQRLEAQVDVESRAEGTRVRGNCELSLRALGAGKVRVPLGAIKLEDAVRVEFDVALTK